jgi:hypothetical protein
MPILNMLVQIRNTSGGITICEHSIIVLDLVGTLSRSFLQKLVDGLATVKLNKHDGAQI